MEKVLYSKIEAAGMLSIGVRTLERLIAFKEVRTRRIGSRVFIPRDELVRLSRPGTTYTTAAKRKGGTAQAAAEVMMASSGGAPVQMINSR